MRRAGVPLEIREDDAPVSCWSEVGLVIRCFSGVAVQLNSYFCGFYILVKIISNRTLPFHIADFRLEVPWQPEKLLLLADPAEQVPPRSAYTFWGMGSSCFRREEVLNHLRNHSFELKRGRPVQGYLLWLAEGEIPKGFSSKAPMPTIISVVDQYGCAYETTAPLLVKRLQRTLAVRKSGRNITGRVQEDGPVPAPQKTGAACNHESIRDLPVRVETEESEAGWGQSCDGEPSRRADESKSER